MRLSKIKLSGFKSFVEPTTVMLPSNLVGIVGPNGCGKSNVIDAIRWVMGESSAKHLRGDSMADVIFNGSASRKPVGTATIELFFDNSDGAIGGQYARYSEVSIKRAVTRDGQSQYYLNNARCRRKDITNLFLGTGLGARSYAIIEQGMVSRLIEAKPDDLRVYIEEAAGISKYKERRRETENRIRHTRDNLDRLNDLRDEVEKQIKHLDRQAKQAERYKALKKDQRRLEAELLAIRLGDLDTELEAQRQALSQGQTRLEAAISEQRAVEASIERARQLHVETSDACNATQGRYYKVQAEISRLEQTIQHTRSTHERQSEELTRTQTELHEIEQEISNDQAQIQVLDESLNRLVPNLDEATSTETDSITNLARVEKALNAWRDDWQEFNLEAKEYQQASHVERARIEHLDARLVELRERLVSIEDELSRTSIDEVESEVGARASAERHASDALEKLINSLAGIDRRIAGLREEEQGLSSQLETARAQLESSRGRAETLEALQEAAMGRDQDDVNRWMTRERLTDQPRLAQQLDVEKGWERAVETVLGNFLQAVCVRRCEDHVRNLPKGDVALVETAEVAAGGDDAIGTLLEKVGRPGQAAGMLRTVRIAGSIQSALGKREKLAAGESVITADGVWLGDGWVRVNRGEPGASGVISREQDIRELRDRIRGFDQDVTTLERDRQRVRNELRELESRRHEVNANANDANRAHAEVAAKLESVRQEYGRTQSRLSALTAENQAIRDEIETLEESIRQAQAKLKHAAEASERLEARRPELQAQQDVLLAEYNAAREKAERDREDVSRIRIEYEGRRASRESATTALERIRNQKAQLEQRLATLTAQLDEGQVPLAGLQQELQAQLEKQVEVEAEMSRQRQQVEAADAALREEEARRAESEKFVGGIRSGVDEARMHVRETEVRREGLAEQFGATGFELEDITAELPEDADAAAWNERLATTAARIERLGAINLAAIEEFAEQSERKTYLDAQFEDLMAALDTLEGAIRKIDRETRARFQETFDSVNAGLGRNFPRLFGGGHAYLSLEGDDLLSAGVAIMARPPGKRNSNIHLLSGGEKALTAVALIFSIFELNPAPFCLLDEVDAPLDDANVGRFCDIVREMSESVQFIIITHNKTTMEMARQLTGVTMSEPGVSRLVSVDIDEAVQLAAS